MTLRHCALDMGYNRSEEAYRRTFHNPKRLHQVDTPKSLEPPRRIWIAWYALGYFALVCNAGYFLYAMVPYILHWNRDSLAVVIVCSLAGLVSTLGVRDMLIGPKERKNFRASYARACQSKHPRVFIFLDLVILPIFPFLYFVILIGTSIWLLTTSAVLAFLVAGVGLLVKAITWVVGTIVAGLPLLVFDRTLTAVNHRMRRRKAARRRAARRRAERRQ